MSLPIFGTGICIPTATEILASRTKRWVRPANVSRATARPCRQGAIVLVRGVCRAGLAVSATGLRVR
jgi:hypothetical protein